MPTDIKMDQADVETVPLRQQIALQCNAVAHMASALADISSDYGRLYHAGSPNMDTIADSVGRRTARQMEILGDILNGMDAVEDDDAWLHPIFEEAQRRWPHQRPHEPDLLSENKRLREMLTYVHGAAVDAQRATMPNTPAWERLDDVLALVRNALSGKKE